MDVDEYMKKHGLTGTDLDAMAEPYETGDYASGGGEVFTGSHPSRQDAVMKSARFARGESVRFTCDNHTLTGTIEVVDYRGWERKHFKNCDWSYDILVEHSPHMNGDPCLYKHIPECDVLC